MTRYVLAMGTAATAALLHVFIATCRDNWRNRDIASIGEEHHQITKALNRSHQ